MNSIPHATYLVCATPRSGSTLLCEMLRATGVAGRPLEHFEILRHSGLPRQPREYFDGLDAPHVLELLAPIDPGRPTREAPQDWWSRILKEGSTENGVWGGKIMWGHVADFLGRARELPGLGTADLETALRHLLGDVKLIFVTRADKSAQAVSLWRAVQTETWRAEDHRGEALPAGVYDFTAIDYLIAQLAAEERLWRDWLTGLDTEPLEVTYEQLDRDACESTAAVLESLGLEDARHRIPAPPTKRQRDDVSASWVERYLRERSEAAA